VLGEDVEDDDGAVQHLLPDVLLQGALLGRGQLVVEHHGVGAHRRHQFLQLRDLAPTDEGPGVGGVTTLDDPLDHLRAGGVEQRGELIEGGVQLLQGGAGQLHPDDHRTLHRADDVHALAGRVVGDDVAPAPTGLSTADRSSVVEVERTPVVEIRVIEVAASEGAGGRGHRRAVVPVGAV